MDDEEEVQGMLPPVAPSLESRSKHKKMPSAMGNHGGRGRGRGRGSADTDTVCIFVHTSRSVGCSLEYM